MKHTLLILTFTIMGAISIAQNVKVQSAYTYLKRGALDKAKTSIEAAMVDPETGEQAKTWFYAGNIYVKLLISEDEKFKDLEPDALDKARKAYLRAMELDSNVNNIELDPQAAKIGYGLLAGNYFNAAADFYNANNFSKALENFQLSIEINQFKGVIDTMGYFYGGLAATFANQHDVAERLFHMAYRCNYSQPKLYSTLSNLYVEREDAEKALEVIRKGRNLYPEDLEIILAETNVYLIMGKGEEALNNLLVAIEKSPENAHLYYVAATKYSEFLSEELFSKDNEKWYGFFSNSEKYYNQAIQLEPAKMEAYYNLGALYVNSGAIVMKVANDLPFDDPKYPLEKKKADDLLEKAIPVLEKAHELSDQDVNTLITLKELYARTSRLGKLQEVKSKLDTLGIE